MNLTDFTRANVSFEELWLAADNASHHHTATNHGPALAHDSAAAAAAHDSAAGVDNQVPITAMGPREVPTFTYVVEGVLLTVISILGLFGNVFSVLGLARNKKSTRSFTKLLIALAVCDLLYLVMSLVIFGIPTLSTYYKKHIYIFVLPVW